MIGFGTFLGLPVVDLPVRSLCVRIWDNFALFLRVAGVRRNLKRSPDLPRRVAILLVTSKEQRDALLFCRRLGCVAAVGSKCLRCRFKLVHFGFFQLMTFKFMSPNDKERHFNKQHGHT
jgi:hypothetical protein